MHQKISAILRTMTIQIRKNEFAFLFLFISINVEVHAQMIVHRDPQIEKMVEAINADSLKSDIMTLVGFGTRHTLSSVTDPKRGIGAAREWILSRFREDAAHAPGKMTVELDEWTLQPDGKRIDAPANMGNAMAILQGTDTSDKRILIISGHMDSRVSDVMNKTADAPGANDDGSGTAAVIECARVMSRNSFPCTIIFVAFCGEEQGLYGSQHLAARAVENAWDLAAVLNNDIIGSNAANETHIIENNKVRVFSEGLPAADLEKKSASIRQYGLENDGQSRELARYINEMGKRYVANLEAILVYRSDRFLRGGDQIPFLEKGFPAVRITEMNENFDHQHQDIRTENGREYGDLPKFMDFEYLRRNTALNLASLASLAKSPSGPQDLRIDVKNLSNTSRLSWKAPRNGKPMGYYILVRETTAPQWQEKIFTTQKEVIIPYSKDNYLFAVQSVSEDGNESLPIIPATGR
ncbi:MAG: M28 family metallopeptidase [Chitinophagales bacterium]